MNPLLLKPEADTHSQVVLMGQVSAELTALPWRGRSQRCGRRSPPRSMRCAPRTTWW
jgi:cobyric acid synthase